MIDLSNSMAVLFASEQHPARKTTVDWLVANIPTVYAHYKEPYIVSRNSAIRDVILPHHGKKEWAILVDNDVTITHPGIDNWLNTDGDVVSCEWGNASCWADDETAFHQTLWRVRIDVLAKIQAPWIDWVYEDDGCGLVYPCDCHYFKQKALAVGAKIRHGGRCSHKGSGEAWVHS